jgi:O-antigen/teichoic acid export membrane protein
VTENHTTDSEERTPLGSVGRGASLFFVGKIASKGLKFLFNLILTQTLGAALYGIYTYAVSIRGFLIVLARLGTGKSVLRFIPAADDDLRRRNSIVALAYLTALLGSVVIGAGLFFAAPVISAYTLDDPSLITVLRIFALVVPFSTIINLTNLVFRALEEIEYQILIADLLDPILRIVTVLIAFALGYSLLGAVAALALGTILTFCAGITLLYSKTNIRMKGDRSRVDVYEFYNFSLPLTLKDLGQKLYTRVDILMVGIFLTGSAVGIYRVAILVATLLTLPLAGVNQLFPPVASKLYSNDKMDELEALYRTVTRWILILVLPAAIPLLVYNAEVLRIFGPEFTDGTFVLSLFTLAQLTNCAVGPSGFLLMMTDHQYLNLANQWLLGVLNVVLNYFFILEFGFVGAAVATAGTLSLINLLRVFQVWYTEQMLPYSRKYWKPVVAGLVCALVMLGLEFFLTGYLLLVVGSLAGGLSFLGALAVFGVEQEDRDFYTEMVKPRLE